MTYRWEPTTPLDRIIETGFKRIDEAIESVVANYTPTINVRLIDGLMAEMNEDKEYTRKLYAVAQLCAQGMSLSDIQRQQMGLQGSLNHCSAGMAAQQNPLANAYQQGLFYSHWDALK